MGHGVPKGIVARPFIYADRNGYLKILVRRRKGKGAWEGELPSNLFVHLKRAIELLVNPKQTEITIKTHSNSK
jgi:hypothetical protein